jgi:DNA-binding NarL/FixJ family response regulator
MEKISILLVEDDPDWLNGLTDFLVSEEDFHLVGGTACSKEAVDILKSFPVDVVLMDIMLTKTDSLDGIDLTLEVTRSSDAKVIMLTSLEDDHVIFGSYEVGAIDYIVKSNFEEIPDAIRDAYHNRSPVRPQIADKIRQEFRRLKESESKYEVEKMQSLFTPSELTILQLIEQGYTQSEMADQLVVSVNTIKKHVNHILRKMECTSSKEAVVRLKGMGII